MNYFPSNKTISMNLLKKYLSCWSILFCVVLFSVGCTQETEGEEMMMDISEVSDKAFTIDNIEYQTLSAYLIFHSVLQYDADQMIDVRKVKNQFSLLFIDGQAISNDGGILYSVDTKHSIYHNFRDIGDVSILDDIQAIPITSETYTQAPSTTTRIDISGISTDVTENDVSYGDPSLAGINYPLSNEDVASLTINSIDIDYDNMTGSLHCEYSIDSGLASGIIAGRFVGTFDILIE